MREEEKGKNVLSREVAELKAAYFDHDRAIRSLSEDTIKLRAEIISFRERLKPETIAGLRAEFEKSRSSIDRAYERLRMFALEVSASFEELANHFGEKKE